MATSKRQRFRTVADLLAAIERDGCGHRVVSPGGLANQFGITRGAVHLRIERGWYRVYQCKRIVLIDPGEGVG